MAALTLKHFPYKKMRNGQKKALEWLKINWDKYRYFVIEAPTGSGKSAIAHTVALSSKKAFVLTATKQLQDQYIRDFSEPHTVDIRGKANYQCDVQPGLNVEIGPCTVNKQLLQECKMLGRCPYYSQVRKADNASSMLTSYQYFLYSTTCGWQRDGKSRSAVILDECHLIEQQLVQWATIVVSPSELDSKYGIKLPKYTPASGFSNNSAWLTAVWNIIIDKRKEFQDEIKDLLQGRDPESLTEDELEEIGDVHKGYYEVDKIYRRFKIFFESDNKGVWMCEPEGDGVILTPVRVDDLFKRFIDAMAYDRVIMMSATVLDIDGFCKNLSLKRNDVAFLRMESEFPPEKSPIIYMPSGNMNYQNLESSIPKIIKNVNKILNMHPNDKGLIHTTTYSIAESIYEALESPRLIMKTDKENNEALIRRHLASKKATVLLSPSMTTGVDLPDNASRFQIIVKLPWGSLADQRIALRTRMDGNWYLAEMLRTFVQACGRSTRSENDWATTYVLDEKFPYWINKAKSWMPEMFLKRIIWNP